MIEISQSALQEIAKSVAAAEGETKSVRVYIAGHG
jgi:Fe-S cluster assembly iron-binding protein IscA